MPLKLTRRQYAEMFGPTVGDRVRLADTELFVQVERDLIAEGGGYGNEIKFGGGKVIRDGMGQSSTALDAESLDLVITSFGSARLSDYDLDVVSPLEITRYTAPEAVAGGAVVEGAGGADVAEHGDGRGVGEEGVEVAEGIGHAAETVRVEADLAEFAAELEGVVALQNGDGITELVNPVRTHSLRPVQAQLEVVATLEVD